MKTTIYKSLSNTKNVVKVNAGQSIEKTFSEIDFENAVILVNGKKQNKDYVLREDDIITIRQLPSAMTAIVGGAFFLAVVGAMAIADVGLKAYEAKQAAQQAQKELEKIKEQTGNNDLDNRPFLRGATNTVATGNSQPYICGRHLFTPYLLCNPFYKLSGTDGKDEYTYTVLECGFSRQIIDSVSIDDVRIKKFNSATPQEGSYSLDGGQVFAEDGLIEISQDGGLLTALPELNYKTVSKACNDEIPRDSRVADGKAEYLTYTLDANAKNVDVAITFPYGLYCYNDSGDKKDTTVTITPQYSLDGGQTEEGWIPFTFDNNGTATNTFSNMDSKNELRYCAHKEFSLSDYQTLKDNNQDCILLRVRSNGNDDEKIKNDCYVLFYQSVCFDTEKSSYPAGSVKDNGANGLVSCKIVEDRERAYCTILGLKIKASVNNEDKLKKINIITQGLARTWNGRNWSADKKATRNPAAWALEILTSDSHPVSKYDASEIDLESFGEFYEYCDDNDFYFDYVIAQNAKKSATLGYIMESCGAVLYWDMYGRLAVAIDRAQENAIAVYNPQNIIGDPQNKKTFGRRTDGLRIKYTTSDNDLYSEETYLVLREGQSLNADSIIKDLTVTGVTTNDHIVKYARRLMAIEELRPKTTTIEVGNEGVYFTPYSKILLQDDSLKIGLGSATIKEVQWQGGLLKQIILNEPVEFSETANCGIIVNCYGDNRAIPLPLKVSGSGRTDTLEVVTNYRQSEEIKPEEGNILSFGELDSNGEFTKITTEYLISNITRSDNGFKLELVNYNEAIYDSGTIPNYKSNITKKHSSNAGTIPPDFPTRDEVTEAITSQGTEAVNEIAELVTHGVRFSNVHKINPVTAETLEKVVNLDWLQNELDNVLKAATDGIEVTEDKITLSVQNKEKDIYSMIELTEGRILEVVSNGEEGLQSAISQTAKDIRQEVSDLNENYTTIQEQTAESINSLVQKTNNTDAGLEEAKTQISQNAKDIILAAQSATEAKDRADKAEENSKEYTQSVIEMLTNQIIAMVDDTAKNAHAAISVKADEIVLQVEDTDKELRSTISQTASEIIAQVDDMNDELTGLLDIQAGAVQALVEGGGASGSLALSIELPAMITETQRNLFITNSSEAKVNAVYAKVVVNETETDYYSIMRTATDTQCKALWNDLKNANLLASQITLDASQINVTGTTVFGSGSLATGLESANQAISNAKIAAAADATSKANAAKNDAISAAADDATSKANAAESNAQTNAQTNIATKLGYSSYDAIETASTIASNGANTAQSNIASKLGYSSYDDMVNKASQGQTIINGGYIRTSLIDVDELAAQVISLNNGGVLKSANWVYKTSGFKIDTYGNAEFNGNTKIKGDVTIIDGAFTNARIMYSPNEFVHIIDGINNMSTQAFFEKLGQIYNPYVENKEAVMIRFFYGQATFKRTFTDTVEIFDIIMMKHQYILLSIGYEYHIDIFFTPFYFYRMYYSRKSGWDFSGDYPVQTITETKRFNWYKVLGDLNENASNFEQYNPFEEYELTKLIML